MSTRLALFMVAYNFLFFENYKRKGCLLRADWSKPNLTEDKVYPNIGIKHRLISTLNIQSHSSQSCKGSLHRWLTTFFAFIWFSRDPESIIPLRWLHNRKRLFIFIVGKMTSITGKIMQLERKVMYVKCICFIRCKSEAFLCSISYCTATLSAHIKIWEPMLKSSLRYNRCKICTKNNVFAPNFSS